MLENLVNDYGRSFMLLKATSHPVNDVMTYMRMHQFIAFQHGGFYVLIQTQ